MDTEKRLFLLIDYDEVGEYISGYIYSDLYPVGAAKKIIELKPKSHISLIKWNAVKENWRDLI
jgi:hypothetical protein